MQAIADDFAVNMVAAGHIFLLMYLWGRRMSFTRREYPESESISSRPFLEYKFSDTTYFRATSIAIAM